MRQAPRRRGQTASRRSSRTSPAPRAARRIDVAYAGRRERALRPPETRTYWSHRRHQHRAGQVLHREHASWRQLHEAMADEIQTGRTHVDRELPHGRTRRVAMSARSAPLGSARARPAGLQGIRRPRALPLELDEAGAYAIGRAFAEQFEPSSIAVGRDVRLSSPSMAEAVIEGAADGGADVLDLGMVGTEMVYFAVGELALDGGVMVTASHNPKQYTGMKIVRRGALPVGGESGLLDVRDRAVAADWRDASARTGSRGGHLGPVRRPGALVRRPRRAAAAAGRDRRGERDGRRDAAAGARAAARCSTSSAATSTRTARSRTTSRTRCCPRTASSSSARRASEGADFGVAYDGDADRCFFVDDTGEFVPGDFITALFAETILAREPGGKVIYDVRASRAVPETIERAGGVPLINRVGHAFIKQRMREVDAVFAGEVSAHYYFRDFSQADSGTVPVPAHVRARLAPRQAEQGARAVPSQVLHHRRDQHPGRGRRRRSCRSSRSASAPTAASRTSTASRSTSTTGTSTCARRTPSRCSA